MTPKDKVRALLHKEAAQTPKDKVRVLLHKEAGLGKFWQTMTKPRAAKDAGKIGIVQDLMRQFKWGRKGTGKLLPGAVHHGSGTAATLGRVQGGFVDPLVKGVKNINNPGKKSLGAAGVLGAGGVATKVMDTSDPDGSPAATPADKKAFAVAKTKRLQEEAKARGEATVTPGKPAPKSTASLIEGVDDRATAAGGGAIAGGVAGYHAADALGVDKITGTVGGAALTAVAAALLAHNMRNA